MRFLSSHGARGGRTGDVVSAAYAASAMRVSPGTPALSSVAVGLLVSFGLSSVVTAKEIDHKGFVADVGTKFAWRASRTPRLLWTGFRAEHDGGEVLVQTSSEVELEIRASKDGPVFVLKGCRVLRRTDELPLETRYFDSPVTRVAVKQHAGDLEIAVSLRQAVTAVPRKEAGPGGSWFWVLAFPPARDAARTTAAATP